MGHVSKCWPAARSETIFSLGMNYAANRFPSACYRSCHNTVVFPGKKTDQF